MSKLQPPVRKAAHQAAVGGDLVFPGVFSFLHVPGRDTFAAMP